MRNLCEYQFFQKVFIAEFMKSWIGRFVFPTILGKVDHLTMVRPSEDHKLKPLGFPDFSGKNMQISEKIVK